MLLPFDAEATRPHGRPSGMWPTLTPFLFVARKRLAQLIILRLETSPAAAYEYSYKLQANQGFGRWMTAGRAGTPGHRTGCVPVLEPLS
eukprot:scaffold46989_cov45-Prasinocladus_malaysianus.AAC.1